MGRRLFNRLFSRDEEDVSNKKIKFNKNDLIEQDKKEFNAEEIEKTITLIQKYGLSKTTVQKTTHNNLKLRKDLGLNDIDYFVLSIILHRPNRSINVNEIVNFVRGRGDLYISIYDILFSLYHKKLLEIVPDDSDIRFHCSNDLLKYVVTGAEFKPDMEMSLKKVIRINDIIANLYNATDPGSNIAEKHIVHILRENSSYPYCKKLLEVYDNRHDFKGVQYHSFLFYIIGHLITAQSGTSINKNSNFIEAFCQHHNNREKMMNIIFNEDDHILFKNKIFDRSIDESGKADKDEIELHAEFKRKYLQGIVVEKKLDTVTNSKNIIKKKMFYNEDNQKQIDDLSNILEKSSFTKVKSRLKKSGMRTGFACLFSGHAGTGKTETAYQIAKRTGRDIIKVDMSSLRSKWWGEDEKNVKAIFTNYKLALQESKLEPILLLNEADAIIGKRLDVSGNNGAIITAINATQNIILEELENFEGILIATTNLTQNFDSAFERRFLYKIEFQKPDTDVKTKLWEHMLTLPIEDAEKLAKKFDYTGAQIENIYRKREVNNILYNNEYDLDKIIELCENECIEEKTKPIGFGN